MEKQNKTSIVSKIGGQAVLEGVMMRSPSSQAMSVRSESGEMLMVSQRLKPIGKVMKVPILRGFLNFFYMLWLGIKVLMKSADAYGTDDEEMPKGLMWCSVILGMILAIGLFIFLPSVCSDTLFKGIGMNKNTDNLYTLYKALFEGGLRLILFVLYLLLTSLMKDIRRTFMYHGAEHKTINCFEHGHELTVENVLSSSKVHNRCGTTFLFLVMAVSILIFALANFLVVGVFGWTDAWWVNLLVRFVLLPFVAGISYEVLKGLAMLPDNWFTRILRAPGLALQKITTKEPDEKMVECAIAAFTEVQALDADANRETVDFEYMSYKDARERVAEELKKVENLEPCEIDWIFCEVLDKKRDELEKTEDIKRVFFNRAMTIVKKRIKGNPLSYCLGNVEFFGEKLKVTRAVLTPRPETELVVEQAVKILKNKKANVELTALDLCTGSGAIACILAKVGKAKVVATDISPAAIMIAKQNCAGFDVEFIESDMFEDVDGKFDVIVSNPPYIATRELKNLSREVKKEPVGALDGGVDGLMFYQEIAKNFAKYLKSNGALVLELGIGQADDVAKMFDGWTIEIIKDYNEIDRIMIVSKEQISNAG